MKYKKICEICNKEFETSWGHTKRCSRECRRIAQNKDYRKREYKACSYTKLRFEILKRDKFTCQYCGSKAPNVKLQVDHIIPISKGGITEIDNLICACEECNLGKSNNKT